MCLKNILKVPRWSSTKEVHQITETLLLEVSRWQHTAIEMFKVYNQLQPQKSRKCLY